jgi:hypothetical protein
MDAIRPEEAGLPSLLSLNNRIQIVGEQVSKIQSELFRLKLVQAMNESGDADNVPGSDQSYSEQRSTYNVALRRIEVKFPEEVAAIREATRGA